MTRIHRMLAGCAPLAGALVLLVGVLAAVPAPTGAQTSDEECRQGLLRLVSPTRDGLRVQLQPGPPFGALISWADLDDFESTCAVVDGLEGQGYEVTLDGFYKDVVDRQINFFAPSGGTVGATDRNRVQLQWNNANLQFTGSIAGEINLSNNGGLLVYDNATGLWHQQNGGLPMYLGQTDLVAYSVSALDGGRQLCGLEDRLNRGLWLKPDADSDWRRLAADLFPDVSTATTRITVTAFSPADANTFVVGTNNRGLFVTRDGGVTFTQLQAEFSSGDWSRRSVTAVSWAATDRFYVSINQLGVYRSADDLASFQRLESFLVPEIFPPAGDSVPPEVRTLMDLGGGRLLAGVRNFGVYESRNGGEDWVWRWTQILAQPTAIDVRGLAVDPLDPDVIVAATATLGLFRTEDGGLDWDQVSPEGSTYPDDPPLGGQVAPQVVWSPLLDRFVAGIDGVGLLTSADGRLWSDSELPAGTNTFLKSMVAPAAGDVALYLATYNGGIYVPNTPLELSRTMRLASTDAAYRNLDFGLSISFSEGQVDSLATFRLKLQDFQGYGVWRSETGDPDDMELIGLYDKNNPETCIQGYCGSTGFYQVPNCYVDKRAACFDFSHPDTVRFFDDDVYDGFQYYYAVTTFDYGNTALSSPASLSSDQVFSARFDGDELAPFGGAGNRVRFDVNQEAQPEKGGEEIYVFPNPLRNTSRGFSQAEDGIEVNFVNLPPESRVRIFTVDGDLVGDLGPEFQEGHSIKWLTRNEEGELLASGVYIYKVEMPSRDDYFGKLVIIR